MRSTIRDKDRSLADIASLRTKLESTTRQLEALKNSDENDFAEQLKAKDEDLRVLRVKESQSAQVCGYLVTVRLFLPLF